MEIQPTGHVMLRDVVWLDLIKRKNYTTTVKIFIKIFQLILSQIIIRMFNNVVQVQGRKGIKVKDHVEQQGQTQGQRRPGRPRKVNSIVKVEEDVKMKKEIEVEIDLTPPKRYFFTCLLKQEKNTNVLFFKIKMRLLKNINIIFILFYLGSYQ